jgi:murein DD-endopeptidase MepM/ murein hydrolase activator NlpD
VPEGNAPCGLVDVFDFPLDPPDANRVSGGGDFGRFRNRYDKYHAGEDWWGGNRGSSFGMPVYSIGHGLVTYAEPNGWGRDQGVVIVRHTTSDGDTFLSFYGHLDPPSVVLNAGDCLVRGEKVGEIGRPRSSPHLHFEIRTHLPYAPGPGYWPEDPTLAGWRPPSQTIWNSRISESPGVQWARLSDAGFSKGVGMPGPNTFVAIEEDQLAAYNLDDGRLSWRLEAAEDVHDAVVDAGGAFLYVADRRGHVEAFTLSGLGDGAASNGVPAEATAPESLWTVDLDIVGTPALMPLPGGGVVFAVAKQMLAFSADGTPQWEEEIAARPVEWAIAGEKLVFSTQGRDGSLWTIDVSGPVHWEAPLSGRPVVSGEQLWFYDHSGVYRLDAETQRSELVYPLPTSFLGLGDMIALPDGGLLLAHRDRWDERLIALDAGGRVRWERSYAGLVQGKPSILELDGRVYLMLQRMGNRSSEISIYSIDLEQAELNHIFRGGSRTPDQNLTWAAAAGDGLILIHIGGGSTAALDPLAADEVTQLAR